MTTPDQNPSETSETSRVQVSAGTASPWLKILIQCLIKVGAVAIFAAVVFGVALGGTAAVNVIAGALLVMVFSGISLLVGHIVGKRNPSAVIGAFLAAYVVKVVGFGILVFAFPRPDWLMPSVFLWSSIGAVILWQIAEMFTFARTRWLLYGDTA